MLLGATAGCLRVLKELGPLAEFVTVFRVTFSQIAASGSAGPTFTIYFKCPLVEEISLGIDHRLMGNPHENNCCPSAIEISNKIMSRLPYMIRERLKESEKGLSRVKDKIESFK